MIDLIVPVVLLISLAVYQYSADYYARYRCVKLYENMKRRNVYMPFANKFDNHKDLLKYLHYVDKYNDIYKFISDDLMGILSSFEYVITRGFSEMQRYIKNLTETQTYIHDIIYSITLSNDKNLFKKTFRKVKTNLTEFSKMMAVEILERELAEVDVDNHKDYTNLAIKFLSKIPVNTISSNIVLVLLIIVGANGE